MAVFKKTAVKILVFLANDLFTSVVAASGANAVCEIVFATVLALNHCRSCELRVV